MASAPVCRFYLKGECKFGERCKFDHPRDLPRNENRFAAFQSPENTTRDNYGRVNSDGRSTPSQTPAFSLNRDIIITDLSSERPQWILSAYGPGSKAPAQLFGGPMREQSFEEMRLHHYNGVASGTPELAIQQANTLVQEAESQMRNVLGNIDSAMDFIRRAENEHPNRNDICQASTKDLSSTKTSASNSFGAVSGAPTQPAFGFGKPSLPGAKPNPFGVSHQAFGQPSLPGSTGAFGQPSVMGQRPNPFGAPSGGTALVQGSGNTSGPFSAFATKPNPFGTPAQPPVPNSFGQANQLKQATPFGQNEAPTENPFAQSGTRSNPFGQSTSQPQPRPFASTTTSASFGAPSPAAQKNPFGGLAEPAQGNLLGLGVNQAPPSNPFGLPNTASPSPNPFAQPASTSSSNPFGHRSTSSSGPKSNPFAPSIQASSPNINGTASQGPYGPRAQFQHPPLQSYVSRDGNKTLKMFKGKPVVYKDNEAGIQNRDGTWEKIWFPDGPPAYYGATELDDEAYKEDIKQAYLHSRQTGSFKDGVMPLLPPKREWCLWDF